ncbi:MAG: hypothetical protein U9O65_04135 [Thermotogota bacterium]|nr:hypothetical protein [Thermotogota bacterium]
MFVRLWKVKNNSRRKDAEFVIEKVRFVFERRKDFMKTEGGGLFRSYFMIGKTCNSRKEVNEVGF